MTEPLVIQRKPSISEVIKINCENISESDDLYAFLVHVTWPAGQGWESYEYSKTGLLRSFNTVKNSQNKWIIKMIYSLFITYVRDFFLKEQT